MTTLHSTKKRPIPFGKYLLLDRICIGGMAEIWRAEVDGAEGGNGRVVAIKRILPNVGEDPDCVAMFMDEARITMRLRHPNIAQVFELGQVGSSHFIAMEYVSGKDLRAIFKQCRRAGAPAPVPMTCYVIAKACEALDHAHRKRDASGQEMQIVHGDVSPHNILVGYEGEVKVIDFGIADVASASEPSAAVLKGKIGYLSPERMQGRPFDRRSDVFGIGVCLCEMLTGERLFASEAQDVILERIRTADVPPPSTHRSGIPEALDRIVLKALARDPENRYQYASELAQDLHRFLVESKAFFERKDLMQFMKSTFADDRRREQRAVDAPQEHERPVPPVSLLPRIEAAGPMLSNSIAEGAADRAPSDLIEPPVRASLSQPEVRPPSMGSTSNAEAKPSRFGPSRLRLLAFAMMGAVATLAAVVFGSAILDEVRSGVLLVELPAEAKGKPISLSISGEELRAPEQGPVLRRMRAGTVPLVINVEGYETFSQKVEVQNGRDPTRVLVQLRPKIQTAQLAVLADPEAAEVRLDGHVVKAAGAADFYLGSIPVGSDQLVEVRHRGYRLFQQRVAAAAPGQRLQVRATLQPLEIPLKVSSKPARATIFVNGRPVGRTPSEVQVLANVGELTLSKRCFEPQQVPLTLPSDFAPRDPKDPLLINVSLKRLPGCR